VKRQGGQAGGERQGEGCSGWRAGGEGCRGGEAVGGECRCKMQVAAGGLRTRQRLAAGAAQGGRVREQGWRGEGAGGQGRRGRVRNAGVERQ
jgi:hypothetical protein